MGWTGDMSFDADIFYVTENRHKVSAINGAAHELEQLIIDTPSLRINRLARPLRHAFNAGARYTSELLSQTKNLKNPTPRQLRKALAFFDRVSGGPDHFLKGVEHLTPLIATQQFDRETVDFLLQKNPWNPPGYQPGAEMEPETFAVFLYTFSDVAQRIYEGL